jgi:hypothetical protein
MKRMILIIATASLFTNCGNSSESDAGADTTVTSTTPPPTRETNPVGIMMGDTTIGINDSLKKDSLKK